MPELRDAVKEKESLWDFLVQSGRNIVLYGMGDGAVKILSVLEKYGLHAAGIFASDEFVRYNEFCSHTVKKLSDIEEEYDDFVILTAFATKIPEVREKIFAIADRHTLFVPDINVSSDPLEVFDCKFFNENYERLNRVYNALDTQESREMFATLINYKLSGKLEYLALLEEYRRKALPLFDISQVESFADIGAYTGDTLIEAVQTYPNLKRAACFEPDPKTFKKLEKTASTLQADVSLFNAAASDENIKVNLFAQGGRNSAVSKNSLAPSGMQKKREMCVDALRPDSVCPFVPDLIKIDAEGSDCDALEGCRGFFSHASPIIFVSVYHNNRDLFEIYEKICDIKKDCKFALRQKCEYIPAWDIELAAYNG